MDGSVKNIMTGNPIVVRPETPLMNAANLLAEKNFRGLPVVDDANRAVGILTEYDLIIHGSSLHLPTFIKIMQEIDLYRTDASLVSDDLRKIVNFTVGDAMNREPFTLLDSAPIEEAAKVFSEHHKINPILIVDTQGKLVGVVSRHDLVKLFGSYNIQFKDEQKERAVDVSVNKFFRGFDRKFVVVSRFRTQTWLMFSAMFFVIGFVVAFALIMRINLDL
jgi:CBS domain-containing protein